MTPDLRQMRRGVLLWASCLAGRFALNAPCPMDRDWHTRSHTLSLSRQRPRDPRRANCWPLSVGGGGGERQAETEGGGDPRLPAESWKKASPVGIGQSQVPQGAWASAELSHQVPQTPHPPPGPAQPSPGGGVGGGHRQEVIERLGPLPPQLPAAPSLQ